MELLPLAVFWIAALEAARFLQVTQTIQLTCYWVSAALSLGLVGLLVALRYRPLGVISWSDEHG